jgi:peptidoglycan/LPS O-acetylase OafA/YrhL
MTAAGRVSAMDGWRGCAILLVLIGHFSPLPFINTGRLGVELFFGLSGCLIGAILFGQGKGVRDFAINRFSRVVPSMWILIILTLPIARWREDHQIKLVAYSALGLGNYFPEVAYRFQHLWSIGVELQGYLFLAAVALICRRTGLKPALLILVAILSSWACTGYLAWQGTDEYYHTYWRFEHRMTAMAFGVALVGMGPEALRRWPHWSVLAIAGAALQLTLVPDVLKYSLGSALCAAGCAKLWFDARSTSSVATWLTSPLLIFMGGASYSIYLWQQIFFFEKENLTAPLACASAVVVGLLAHFVWDKKVHLLSRKLLFSAFGAIKV